MTTSGSKAHDINPTMSGKGIFYDNAMVETVFKTIKNELILRTSFQTRKTAELALADTLTASAIHIGEISL
jgi:putative transposase